MRIYNFKLWNNYWHQVSNIVTSNSKKRHSGVTLHNVNYKPFFKIILFICNFTLSNRLKIIIKNGESVETYNDAGDVVVLPKSKLVRRFSEYGSLIEEYKLVDKKITLDDDLDNDQTEIVVTLLVKK